MYQTLLTTMADRMYADGYKFYLSVNGVWLMGHVPTGYLAIK
jgi:RNA:NAD 2'-phosphotransferase (TPT1/KptA family)